jgi:hypothetical protein
MPDRIAPKARSFLQRIPAGLRMLLVRIFNVPEFLIEFSIEFFKKGNQEL